MKRFILPLSLVLCLFAAACTSRSWVVQDRDPDALVKQFKAGNDNAAYELGVYYCIASPAEADHGDKARKWLATAVASSDHDTRLRGLELLGNLELSLFDDPDYYTPGKDKPKPYCTGTKHTKENSAKAVSYLKTCVRESNPILGTRCPLSLGHHYSSVHDYAEAYFWYARSMAENDYDDATEGYPVRSLLDVMHRLNAKTEADSKKAGNTAKPMVDADKKLESAARFAAKHLSRKQIAELDKKAILQYAHYVKKDYNDWAARVDWRGRTYMYNP